MSLKTVFFVLGPDNVGKTTTIKKSIETLENIGYSCFYYHFSAPKNESAYMMYKNVFENISNNYSEGIDYYFFDRGWPESYFYEKFRRGVELSLDEMWSIEDELEIMLKNIRAAHYKILLLYRTWQEIEPHHIKELETPVAFNSNILTGEKLQLEERKKEHTAYYQDVYNYLKTECRFNFEKVRLKENYRIIP